MKASTYDYKIIRGKWLIYCKYGQGVIFTTNQSTCPVPNAMNKRTCPSEPFFGIHTANAVHLAGRLAELQETKAA